MNSPLTPEQIKALLANKDKLPVPVRTKLASLLATREKLIQTQNARIDFMAFTNAVWPSFIGGAHHKKMAAAFERVARGECKRLIINMAPRHALTLDTLIPTTSGMKTMETLCVGDYVFGPDGNPVQVMGKSEVFHNRPLYRVWTDDDAYIDTDGEHLWTVRLDRKRPKLQTYTTEQLWHRQNGAYLRTKRGGGVDIRLNAINPANVRLPRLPDVAPAQYPPVHLPIDPYVLGVWLGDGTSLQAIITSHDADAAIVRPEFERRGYSTTDQATKMSFGVLNLKVKLRDLGVLGNKHIPDIYLRASEQQRRDLLKGLMDTDGNISKGGQCFFAQSNKALCLQVQQLIRSLGIKASLLESRAMLNGKDCGPTWKVSFYASDVFFLPRKEARTLKNDRAFGRYIRVEKLATVGNTQCIRVDREDGLFLAGDGYICTHNTKSEFASYLLPAWYLGLFPERKIIQSSHTAELAVGFGRKVRNLVDSEAYKEIFPKTELRSDSKAAGRWATSKGGDYFAIGIGGAVTGKGADLLIIDDPHSEQEATLAEANPEIYDKTYEWYTSGPRQRLQPGGAIVVVMTRWSKKDLTGQILKAAAQRSGEEWDVIEFPAILPSGNPLWPEFWSLKELEALRNELPNGKWMAQYMQQPTSDVSAIIKRDWWKIWDNPEPPPCEFIIQSWDTAFERHERADYSACTTWGVFYQEDGSGIMQANIILLNSFKVRLEFPELKKRAKQEADEWQPDSIIIEKKASGAPLIYELRAAGIPVQEFTPSKGNDKISRLNAVSDMFASGRVWAPATRWAEELIDEVASFPSGEHDDLVDSTSQAMMRFRKGGFLRLPSDFEDDDDKIMQRRRATYY